MSGTWPRSRWMVSLVTLGMALGARVAQGQAAVPPALEAPVTNADAEPSVDPRVESPPVYHEALRPEGQPAPTIRAPKAPPIPVEEQQSDDRSDARAQWVSGYWSWDDGLSKFVWISGTWAVPPSGRFWVDGTWRRDENGWYRVRGFWSSRKGANATANPTVNAVAKWRRNGPPPAVEEDPGPAPGPNTFYVPGHYEPTRDGADVTWVPGFWSNAQPGWDWVPARWVRLANGWDYRAGYWSKDRPEGAVPLGEDESRRHTVARPRVQEGGSQDTLPPAIVDADPDRSATRGEPRAEGLPADRVYVTPGVVTPFAPGYPVRPGMGPYPYGPYGYYDGRLVPRGAVLPFVPPFVRGLLDRVMP